MSEAPSPFSSHNPRLQMAWDATSLKELMTCPRKYQYTILEGYRGSSTDLEFGGFFASATERYKKARLSGLDKLEATKVAVRYVLEASGHHEDGVWVPWGGAYEEQWHCTGTVPFHNAKGNRAKCPFSFKDAWFPGEGPGTCTCGSPTEHENRWIPWDTKKDRFSLVRLVVWYCDEQPETPDDGVFPFAFSDGTPAVELSVRLPLPFKNAYGEPFVLAGHLDNLGIFGRELWIEDDKTTTKTLGTAYFSQWAPSVQMDTYDLLGSILWPDLNLQGVIVSAAQIMAEGARFGRQAYRRTEAQRQEFLDEIGWWLGQAERFAEAGYWPMNRASCYLCPFKGVCSRDPDKREGYLKADFEVRKWNPLEER